MLTILAQNFTTGLITFYGNKTYIKCYDLIKVCTNENTSSTKDFMQVFVGEQCT